MKRKIVVIMGLIILTSLGIIFILNSKNKPYEITNDNDGQFAFFYEDENGDYQRSTESKWDSGNYILNLESSTCDGENNPSFLTWNNDNNSVTLTRNKATKCNLYFDIKTFDRTCDEDLLSCFIAKKQGTKVGNNNEELIYHNGLIDVNEDGTFDDAGDLSYRYSGDNPDNFVCFGTDQSPCPVKNLYRIIGVFPVTKEDGSIEYQAKLIKSEYITQEELGISASGKMSANIGETGMLNIDSRVEKITDVDTFSWIGTNSNNNWKISPINTALNNNYYYKFSFKWQNLIANSTWFTGGVDNFLGSSIKNFYNHELGNDRIKVGENKCVDSNNSEIIPCVSDMLQTKANIGLLYVSDYLYSSGRINWSSTPVAYGILTNRNSNWLYNGLYEFTISHSTENTNLIYHIDGWGYVAIYDIASQVIRPTFYLNANTLYLKGTGTSSDPFIISDGTYDYNYKPEAQEFTAPIEGDYKIELWGAQGGDSGTFNGGKGAYATGIIHLKDSEKLYIYTGEQGHAAHQNYNGTFNGGAEVGLHPITTEIWGGTGGGATDIRLNKGNNWKDFYSLKSRIMVAAGGGGASSRSSNYGDGKGGDGGALKGIDGQIVNNIAQGYGIGLGASQVSGGKSNWYSSQGSHPTSISVSGFGYSGPIYALHDCRQGCDGLVKNSEDLFVYSNQNGGGGGYYGGGSSTHGSSGGGSSYISGYQGCVAIKDTSTEGNVVPKDNCTEENALNNIECSYHYSQKLFIATNMKAGNESMPSPNGGIETGHSGNGYARITLINYGENAVDLSGNGYDGNFIGNLKIQKDADGRQGLYFDGNESYVDIVDLPETIKWNDGFSYEFEAKWLAFNNYSRIFDFGNGIGIDNIVFCNLQELNRAYPSVFYGTNRYEDTSESSVRGLVLGKRVKIKVTYEKLDNGFNEIIYKDDELVRTKFWETKSLATEVNRTSNYLGRSNWNESFFYGYIYNIKFTDSNGKPILWYDFSR